MSATGTDALPLHTVATPRSRQPRGLYLVSVFELAERFSYFGMMAILLYYIYYSTADGGLGLDLPLATALVGAYSGVIYLSSVAGSWVADRLLGATRTLTLGACLVLAGHICLALLPGLAGLLAGMALVALGSGATKATTTSLVGSFYEARDPQRIIGFTIFYLSLNVGALVGGLATAFLQQSFGFHVGFGAAAIGMVIGLAVFLPARSGLPAAAKATPSPASRVDVVRAVAIAIGLIAVLAVLFLTGIITLEDASLVVACVSVLAAIAYLVLMRFSSKVSSAEFAAVVRYLPIFVVSVVQIALWIQLYTAVGVHAEARSDRSLFGFELPPSTAISFGAVFAIVLTPVVNGVWRRLGVRQPGTAGKYAISLLILAASFAIMAAWSADATAMIPVLVMLGIVGAFYLADLVASPAGLSYATMSAPRSFSTQMVALHLLSYAIGSSLAGVVATAYTPDNASQYFLVVAAVATVVAVVLFVFRKSTGDSIGSVDSESAAVQG